MIPPLPWAGCSREEIFTSNQSIVPLVELEAISFCPSTWYSGKDTNFHCATASFQVTVESDEVFSLMTNDISYILPYVYLCIQLQ